MARLFKRSSAKTAPWYATYMEPVPNGRPRKRTVSTKTSCHATASRIAKKLEAEAAVRHHGLVDVMAERIAKEAALPVEHHTESYKNKLRAAGRTKEHIDRTASHITEFATFACCTCVRDFAADDANRWAASLKDGGLAARTIQARLASIKGFATWLFHHDKLPRDPFASVTKPDPASDRKRERRMLRPDEWPWLMSATIRGETFKGCPAEDRQLVYRLAVQTGLRAGEIRSLGRGNFFLESKRPYVTVKSANTKNRNVAHQYIDEGLAADLARHFASTTTKAKAFALPRADEMADMLRADLNIARRMWLDTAETDDERANRQESTFLSPTNEAGESLDFHALRHTCGGWLAMRGVQPKVIQSVMRHSSITLTLDTYGHLIDGAEAAAVIANADMTAVPSMLAATGADTCFSFVSHEGAEPCLPGAKPCEPRHGESSRTSGRKHRDLPGQTSRFASTCDPVREDTKSRAGRTRTRDLGIMSPQL